MEVRSAKFALLNRAAAAIDSYGSDGKERQHSQKDNNDATEDKKEIDEQSVMLSLSAAGLRRSLLLERQAAKEERAEETFSGEKELEEMTKQMEGLSSQVINGHFSISDRLNFNTEISMLANEINRLRESSSEISKDDCTLLSQRISDLTRIVNDAAVYRSSSRAVFVVDSRQPARAMRKKVDIAI